MVFGSVNWYPVKLEASDLPLSYSTSLAPPALFTQGVPAPPATITFVVVAMKCFLVVTALLACGLVTAQDDPCQDEHKTQSACDADKVCMSVAMSEKTFT